MKGTLVSAVMMWLLLAGFSASGQGPQHFPQELPSNRNAAKVNQRATLQATVFPEFVFTGTFEGAIEYLMVESKKYSPDKISVGGFVLRQADNAAAGRINVRLRGRNALELIDNLCALTGYNWTLKPHCILIHRP